MKTKRLLAVLLVAMFVIAAIPLSAAATPNPWTYSYKIDVKYALADGTQIGATQQYDAGELVWKQKSTWPYEWYWESKNVTVSGANNLPAGYHLVGKTQEVVEVRKPQHSNSFSKTVVFTVEENTYDYAISYAYYLDGVINPSVTKAPITGSAIAGTVINAEDGTQTVDGNTYTLGDGQSLSLTISAEGSNSLTLTYYATTPEIPESPDPVYLPPQVLIPATPTPEPEIELPEEEIPTDVPDETTEIEEEEELFEDEEIPTDVPETGDASPIIPAIALLTLAGAAFALTFKKSRNNG